MNIRFILLAAFGLGLPASADDDLPFELKKLVKQRSMAIEKVDAAYRAELQKLKVKYTQEGDLERANTIASLMRKIGSAHGGSEREPIVRIWKWPNGRFVACLEGGKMVTLRGFVGSGTWKGSPLNDNYEFIWPGGSTTKGRMEDDIIHLEKGAFSGGTATALE